MQFIETKNNFAHLNLCKDCVGYTITNDDAKWISFIFPNIIMELRLHSFHTNLYLSLRLYTTWNCVEMIHVWQINDTCMANICILLIMLSLWFRDYMPFHNLKQRSATYGPRAGSGPPRKNIWLAASLQIVVVVWPARVVSYFMNLPSLQQLVLHTYEELLMRNRPVLQMYCMSYFVLPLWTVNIRG